jgi:hypothetical protein
LQWSVFNYAIQKNKNIEAFDEQDWINIAQFIPSRDQNKCIKRWLFIQKLGGNKSAWSEKEDIILRNMIEEFGAKEWTKIAEQFNLIMQIPGLRNGKQCRERWMNILDPQIKKSKWTL